MTRFSATGQASPSLEPITQVNWPLHWRRVRSLFWDDGGLYLLVVAGALLLAVSRPWIGVPLIMRYDAWSIPVDLGWGVTLHLLSYGLVCVALSIISIARLLIAGWATWRPDHPASLWRWRLSPRSLVQMGSLSVTVSLLFCFQFLFVDFGRVAQIFAQDNESRLIQDFLGYSIQYQLLPQSFSRLSPDSLGDRFTMLVNIAYPGLVLPLVAGLVAIVGAWQVARIAPRLRQRRMTAEDMPDGATRDVPDEVPASSGLGGRVRSGRGDRQRMSSLRLALALGAIVAGVIILGRAPAGLVMENLGEQAISAGNYNSALAYFRRARTLNPGLEALLAFHFERGQALYQLGNPTTFDARLYSAEHFRKIEAPNRAQQIDELLLSSGVDRALVEQDLARTLEWSIWATSATVSAQLPAGSQELVVQTQLVALANGVTILPDLNELATTQSGDLLAYYLRGRILYTNGDYVHAAASFERVIGLATDREMLSTSYTYLAFCYTNLGDLAQGRALLLKAVKLDDYYFNTTARDAASGLQ